MCLVRIIEKCLCTEHLKLSEVLGGRGVLVSRIAEKKFGRRNRLISSVKDEMDSPALLRKPRPLESIRYHQDAG